MLNILILASNDRSARIVALVDMLEQTGYNVGTLVLGKSSDTVYDMRRLFNGSPPDVMLADLSNTSDCLPMQHASRVLHDVWGRDCPAPARLALFLSAHLAMPDWPAHADDFVLPPYSLQEVCARLKICAYRKRQGAVTGTLTFGDVVIDVAGREVRSSDGDVIRFTPREYDLLCFLCEHRGKFFSRDRLLDFVWGVDFEGSERTVDVHIRRIRSKLPSGSVSLLETGQGGYRLRSLSK